MPLRKKRTGSSSVQELRVAYVTLLRTADRVRAVTANTVELHGITGQQYNVLRILRGAGPKGLPTLTIANRMIEQAPGMTRMIDRLEAKGLAARKRRPEDRRCVDCWITSKGLALLAKLDKPVDEANKRVFAALDPREVGQLVRLLDLIRMSRNQNVRRRK